MVSENAARPWPTMKRGPHMVENQCGFTDISQSVMAKVTVSA
jgi:hypothetical protein